MVSIAETKFPNGLDVDAGHVGNVPAYVTADGARVAVVQYAGTAGGTVSTGLATCTYAVGSLTSAAGTGSYGVAVRPGTGGAAIVEVYNSSGAAATSAGTVTVWAVGT